MSMRDGISKQINIHVAKTQFSKLVAEVEGKGERLVSCRHGVPVADLVAHKTWRFIMIPQNR